MADGRFADLRLVATELVTNCVRHGAQNGPMSVSVRPSGHVVRVEVTCATGCTQPRISPVSATGGRGLRVVDAVSRAWGVHESGRDTMVWAEIPLA